MTHENKNRIQPKVIGGKQEFQSLISLEGCQKEQCLSCWPNHTGNNHLCCFNSYACCWVIWKRL